MSLGELKRHCCGNVTVDLGVFKWLFRYQGIHTSIWCADKLALYTSFEKYCSSLAHLHTFERSVFISSSEWQEIFTWPELLGDGHLAHGPAGLRGDHSTNAVKQRWCLVGPLPTLGFDYYARHLGLPVVIAVSWVPWSLLKWLWYKERWQKSDKSFRKSVQLWCPLTWNLSWVFSRQRAGLWPPLNWPPRKYANKIKTNAMTPWLHSLLEQELSVFS